MTATATATAVPVALPLIASLVGRPKRTTAYTLAGASALYAQLGNTPHAYAVLPLEPDDWHILAPSETPTLWRSIAPTLAKAGLWEHGEPTDTAPKLLPWPDDDAARLMTLTPEGCRILADVAQACDAEADENASYRQTLGYVNLRPTRAGYEACGANGFTLHTAAFSTHAQPDGVGTLFTAAMLARPAALALGKLARIIARANVSVDAARRRCQVACYGNDGRLVAAIVSEWPDQRFPDTCQIIPRKEAATHALSIAVGGLRDLIAGHKEAKAINDALPAGSPLWRKDAAMLSLHFWSTTGDESARQLVGFDPAQLRIVLTGLDARDTVALTTRPGKDGRMCAPVRLDAAGLVRVIMPMCARDAR